MVKVIVHKNKLHRILGESREWEAKLKAGTEGQGGNFPAFPTLPPAREDKAIQLCRGLQSVNEAIKDSSHSLNLSARCPMHQVVMAILGPPGQCSCSSLTRTESKLERPELQSWSN